MNCKFTPLSKSLHSIMNKLVSANIITLPPGELLLPSTTSSMYINPKAFYKLYRQPGHDNEAYYSLDYNI